MHHKRFTFLNILIVCILATVGAVFISICQIIPAELYYRNFIFIKAYIINIFDSDALISVMHGGENDITVGKILRTDYLGILPVVNKKYLYDVLKNMPLKVGVIIILYIGYVHIYNFISSLFTNYLYAQVDPFEKSSKKIAQQITKININSRIQNIKTYGILDFLWVLVSIKREVNIIEAENTSLLPYLDLEYSNHLAIIGDSVAAKNKIFSSMIMDRVQKGQKSIVLNSNPYFLETFYDGERDTVVDVSNDSCPDLSVRKWMESTNTTGVLFIPTNQTSNCISSIFRDICAGDFSGTQSHQAQDILIVLDDIYDQKTILELYEILYYGTPCNSKKYNTQIILSITEPSVIMKAYCHNILGYFPTQMYLKPKNIKQAEIIEDYNPNIEEKTMTLQYNEIIVKLPIFFHPYILSLPGIQYENKVHKTTYIIDNVDAGPIMKPKTEKDTIPISVTESTKKEEPKTIVRMTTKELEANGFFTEQEKPAMPKKSTLKRPKYENKKGKKSTYKTHDFRKKNDLIQKNNDINDDPWAE